MTQIIGWTEQELLRFWSKVNKGEGCWEHTGAPSSAGYSQCFSQQRGVQNAHRVSYEVHFGPVQPGTVVRHTCCNKRCVNPDHLCAGTHHANMQDLSDSQSHPQRKLTQLQAREIRESSDSQRALAARYGVTQVVISNIKAGKTYREQGEQGSLPERVVNFGRKNTPKETIELVRIATGPYKEIAKLYGISFSFVGRIKRGEVCKLEPIP